MTTRDETTPADHGALAARKDNAETEAHHPSYYELKQLKSLVDTYMIQWKEYTLNGRKAAVHALQQKVTSIRRESSRLMVGE